MRDVNNIYGEPRMNTNENSVFLFRPRVPAIVPLSMPARTLAPMFVLSCMYQRPNAMSRPNTMMKILSKGIVWLPMWIDVEGLLRNLGTGEETGAPPNSHSETLERI